MEENPLKVSVECCASCVFCMAMTDKPSCGVHMFKAVAPFYHCMHYISHFDTAARVYIDNVKEARRG